MTGQNGHGTVTSAPLTLVPARLTRSGWSIAPPGPTTRAWNRARSSSAGRTRQRPTLPTSAEAAELARDSDVAVVFANTFESEQRDRASLALPEDQDQLVRAVSARNPNTIVVLAAAGPVTMPWLRRVRPWWTATSPARNKATRSPASSSATSTHRASCRSPSRETRASRSGSASEPVGNVGNWRSRSTRGSSSATAATTGGTRSALPVRTRPLLHAVQVPELAVEAGQTGPRGRFTSATGAAHGR